MGLVKKTTDGVLGIIFSSDKTHLWLIGITFFGLILRIIAAYNLGVYADDMHHAVHASNIINSGKLETWDQSSALWHYITDLNYKIFGVGQMASRLSSILFGTATIIVMFMLVKHIFDRKTGLIATLILQHLQLL